MSKNEEQGIISVFALGIMFVLLSLSMAIYTFSRSELMTMERFLFGREADMTAQNGVAILLFKLNSDNVVLQSIINGSGKTVQIYGKESSENDAKCSIYTKVENSRIKALIIAKKKNVSQRLVAYCKKNDSGRYIVEKIER